jgi:hypothetical protein
MINAAWEVTSGLTAPPLPSPLVPRQQEAAVDGEHGSGDEAALQQMRRGDLVCLPTVLVSVRSASMANRAARAAQGPRPASSCESLVDAHGGQFDGQAPCQALDGGGAAGRERVAWP